MHPLLLLLAQSGALNSFESMEELSQLHPRNAQIETVADRSSDGEKSLKITFLPSDWPNLQFKPKQAWNWSDAGGLAFDVSNPSTEPVRLGVRVDDDPSGDGWRHSRSGTIVLPPGANRAVTLLLADTKARGMQGVPPYPGLSTTANGEGDFDLRHIDNFQIFLDHPKKPVTVFVDNVRTVPSRSFKGIVDRFGQYAGADWPGKIHAEIDLKAQATTEDLDDKNHPPAKDRDRFGGWLTGPKLKATGFFRTERRNGKWWFVDPDGRLFFSAGIDTIAPWEASYVSGREDLYSWLPGREDPLSVFRSVKSSSFGGKLKSGETYAFYAANNFRKYGKDWTAKWREQVFRRLSSWGFNTVGNWSDPLIVPNQRIPYVATGSVGGDHARVRSGSDYWGEMHDPFDPKFESDVATSLHDLTAKVKTDPWCLGYFIDNELSWVGQGPDGRYGLASGALGMGATSPARGAFIAQLQRKYVDLVGLNRAWKTSFSDWSSVRLPSPLSEVQKTDASIFVKSFALRYFTTVRDYLRKEDPQHLYMGCRFAWRGPEVEDAAGEICDVVSFNIYAKGLDRSWDAVSRFDKPCMIGEFHFGALDRGMFHGGVVPVASQAERARCFESYVSQVLHHPAFVGCHWFQYTDEPLTGRFFDGENFNIGFVSVTDTPYPEMVAAARRSLGALYRTRSASSGRKE